MAQITQNGNPIHTNGELPAVGAKAPDFKLTGGDLKDVSLADYRGKRKILNIAIDWLSRPPGDLQRVFGGKHVALMGASGGLGGTVLAQAAWLPVIHALGAMVWPGPGVYVSLAGKAFDGEGRLVDDNVRAAVIKQLTAFAQVLRH
jgi:hypothetical protein